MSAALPFDRVTIPGDGPSRSGGGPVSALVLLHHAPGPDGWGSNPAVGHPEVTEAMERALRLRVVPHVVAAEKLATTWWPCDSGAWAAVTDLHRGGYHDAATALAVLLRWCDARCTGRDEGCWEIVRGGSR